MKTIRYIASASLAIVLGLSLSLGAQARLADTDDSGVVLQLGKVEVKGQKSVMQALQAIKLALKRPESSAADQQNVIVCRIEKDIGSHQQDMLTCATNHTLQLRREATQSGMIAGCESVEGTSCYADQAFSAASPLSHAIQADEGHMLHMVVNAASLKSLLAKIPDSAPEATTAPAAGSTPTPAASTAPDHG